MRVWKKEDIHNLLDKNPKAVMRALVAIYNLQTADEQASHTTSHANSVGFSAFDAEFCTDMAQKALKGWNFSEKQLAVTRNKMKRYHRQLVMIANEVERKKFVQVAPVDHEAEEHARLTLEIECAVATAEQAGPAVW